MYTGKVEIKLNPLLSPQKNAENLYRKSKNQNLEIDKLTESLLVRENHLENLKTTVDAIEESDDINTKAPKYWLVDPLDGTKEFINKNGEFTVNIALIENRYPVEGYVYSPTMKTLYIGGKNKNSYK